MAGSLFMRPLMLGICVVLIGGVCRLAAGHPWYVMPSYNTGYTDCSQCHSSVVPTMTTTPVSGSSLLFPKTLLGRSSTASFTVTNTSTASLQTTAGGGGFSGSFPAASGPFSPTNSQAFNTTAPSNPNSLTGPYSFILPPGVVATDGGQSSVSQVYTFAPTTRGTSSQTITFTPSIGFYSAPSSTITLSG